MKRIGVDVGGTKIEGVVLDQGGSELGRVRVVTPRGDYAATVSRISELVAGLEGTFGPTLTTVGIGTPGAIDPATGLLKNSNSTALNGQPLHLDLETALGRPVVLRNDANC
ncbi:MAG: ROK family protein, partial [Acidimicrobiia bacterium]